MKRASSIAWLAVMIIGCGGRRVSVGLPDAESLNHEVDSSARSTPASGDCQLKVDSGWLCCYQAPDYEGLPPGRGPWQCAIARTWSCSVGDTRRPQVVCAEVASAFYRCDEPAEGIRPAPGGWLSCEVQLEASI
jgi:hypothetical protein